MKKYVGEGSYVYNLISKWLNLPYLNEDGVHISCNHIHGKPVGDLSRILYNLTMKETFDREFAKKFPGVAVSRFITQVFIGTKTSDCVVFNNNNAYPLLYTVGMDANIVSIGPGDDPIACYENMTVSIDYDSKSVLVKPLYSNIYSK